MKNTFSKSRDHVFGKKIIPFFLFLSLLLAYLLPYTCTAKAQTDPQASESSSRYVDSMNTLITLTAYGSRREEALDAAEKEIIRLNELLSTGISDSEISRLNEKGKGIVTSDTMTIIEKSLELYESTGHLFDITIYPLMQLWGFATADTPLLAITETEDLESFLAQGDEHHYHVPDPEELSEALSKIGSDRLVLDAKASEVTLGEGQTIDLGGIAKGYASSRIMQLFRDMGVSSATVSLGGNVHCLNVKPDGSMYKIAVRSPFDHLNDYAAILEIANEAVITSGGYERFFVDEASGKTYQHIMDPRTGYPAESDLASVSIITNDGMLGDGLSTSLYIMGEKEAVNYWRRRAKDFEMLLITQDGELLITEGLADRIVYPVTFTILERED